MKNNENRKKKNIWNTKEKFGEYRTEKRISVATHCGVFTRAEGKMPNFLKEFIIHGQLEDFQPRNGRSLQPFLTCISVSSLCRRGRALLIKWKFQKWRLRRLCRGRLSMKVTGSRENRGVCYNIISASPARAQWKSIVTASMHIWYIHGLHAPSTLRIRCIWIGRLIWQYFSSAST